MEVETRKEIKKIENERKQMELEKIKFKNTDIPNNKSNKMVSLNKKIRININKLLFFW